MNKTKGNNSEEFDEYDEYESRLKEPCLFYLRGHCNGLNTGRCKKDHSMKLCMLPRSACGKACEEERHPGDCFQYRDLGYCGWRTCSYRHNRAEELLPRNCQPRGEQHMVLLVATGSGETDSGLSEQNEMVDLIKDLQNKIKKTTNIFWGKFFWSCNGTGRQ